MTKPRIFTMSFAKVYPLLVAKAVKKGRTSGEVDQIIHWLTGYTQNQQTSQLTKEVDVETFFAQSPHLNPARALITGTICGVRVETIIDPTMQTIRQLDKLIDELAHGKSLDQILRQ